MFLNNELRLLIKNELEYLIFLNNSTQKITHINKFIYNKYTNVINDFINNNILNNKYTEKLYFYINDLKEIPTCLHCKNNVTTFYSYKLGYAKYCSAKCVSNGTKQKRIATNLKKYNCEYGLQSTIVKNKRYKSNLLKYGVKNVYQAECIKTKIKNTNNKLYGCDNPMQNFDIKNKAQQTYKEKTGYDNPSQNPKVKQQKIETTIINFNVQHHMQNSIEFKKHQKSSFKLKNYTFPSGKIVKIQGYENFALDILLETCNEYQILINVKDMPEIWYYTDDNKSHRYYCDIFIPSENKLIEVKSKYTFELYEKTNLLKQQASKDLGYDHEIWIIDPTGHIIEKII